MCMITLFRSAFNGKYECISVQAGERLKDYEQMSGIDFTNALVYVNGFQKDENYILKHDDVCTVRLFPSAVSGIVVAGIVAAGVAFGVADIISVNVTGKGIVDNAVEGLRKWLIGDKSESAENGKQAITSVPTLAGAKNQTQNGRAYPLVMGRHLYTPCYIGGSSSAGSQGYHVITGTDGTESIYHGLYMLGYNHLRATEFSFGMVTLAHNKNYVNAQGTTVSVPTIDDGTIDCSNGQFGDNDPHLEIRQGTTEVSLYPEKVVEENLGIELTCLEVEGDVFSVKPVRFSASYPRKVQLEFYFNGLISYGSDGSPTNAVVSIKTEYSLDGGATWHPFPTKIGQNQTLSGTSTYDGTTGVSTLSFSVAKQIRLLSDLELPYSSVKNCTNHVIEIRVSRTNVQSDDGNTADSAVLSAIRTWCYDPEKSKESDGYEPLAPVTERDKKRTVRLGLTMKGTEYLQGQLDELNCIVESKGRTCTYNAQTDTYTWTALGDYANYSVTNNPASVALLVLQSEMRGDNAYSDDRIDLYSFGKFYKFCETNGYKCNGVLTSQMKTSEVMQAVLACGRGSLVLSGTKYGVLIDSPRDNVTLILNNQNVLEASNSKSFEKLPDGYRCTFVNEDNGYTEDEIIVLYDTSLYGSYMRGEIDLTLESVTVPYVTNPDQLYKHLRYQLACRKLRPEVWHRKVSTEGNLVELGDLVEVQDDTILVGIGDGAEIKRNGVIIEGDYITGIKTDGRFPVTDITKTYGVKIVQSDGINQPAIIKKQVTIASTGMQTDFVFTEPISLNEAVLPSEGDIVAFGLFDKITIDAICFGKKENGDGTFDLTLIPYDGNVYTADSGQMPEFNSKVTPPMDVGAITEKYATSLEMMKSQAEMSGAVNSLINGTADIGNPDNVSNVSAVATESGVIVKWNPIGSGLQNSLKEYVVAFSSDSGVTWNENYAKTQDNTYTREFTSSEFFEKSNLDTWRFKVKAVNLYGKASLLWSSSTGTAVTTTGYGTWNVGTPTVVGSVRNRMLMLNISTAENLNVYGNVKAHIQIQRQSITRDDSTVIPADSGWYAPDASDPYGANETYRDTSKNNLEYDLGTYTLTVPLYGQGSNPVKMYNTPYKFKVWLSNEKGADTEHAVEVTLTADITGIKDLVQSNLTQKEAVVQNLAALSAKMGSVSAAEIASESDTDGSLLPSASKFYLNGNENHEEMYIGNVTKSGAEAYEGGTATGSTDNYEFLHFKAGSFWFKLKNFIVTSIASIISGIFRVKADNSTADANSFLTVNPSANADSVTGVPAQTMNVNGALTIDGHLIRKVYEIDLTQQESPYDLYYYPIVFDIPEEQVPSNLSTGYELDFSIIPDCSEYSIASPCSLSIKFIAGSHPHEYNSFPTLRKENGIFQVSYAGNVNYSYSPMAFIKSYAGNVIWLLSGLKYKIYSNYKPFVALERQNVKNGGIDYYVDKSYQNGFNSNMTALWKPPVSPKTGWGVSEHSYFTFSRTLEEDGFTINWNKNKEFSVIDGELEAKISPLVAYPVGSIYMSVNSTNPSTLFGGNWEAISQGRVLIGAGAGTDTKGNLETFVNGAQGGEYKHTLIKTELPKHSHALSGDGVSATVNSITKSGWLQYKGIEGVEVDGAVVKKNTQNWNYGHSGTSGQKQGTFTFVLDHDHSLSGETSTVGSDAAHNNIQPYLVVYMWKRIS